MNKKDKNSIEFINEFTDLTHSIHKKIFAYIKSNPLIISAFSGKEDLLNEVINFQIHATSELIESIE